MCRRLLQMDVFYNEKTCAEWKAIYEEQEKFEKMYNMIEIKGTMR